MSREEAIQKVTAFRNYLMAGNPIWDVDEVREAFDMAIEALANDPVKHGRWKYTEAHPHWMFCDQCFKRIVPNKEWIKEYNIPTNYCPNCGARMEGEEG